MASVPKRRTWSGRTSAAVVAFGACCTLVTGTALVGIGAPVAAADEASASVEPTVSEVGFIEATVESGYVDGEAVPEEVGDLQQVEAVAPGSVEPSDSDVDAQARRALEGEIDVNIVRTDLETDNALVGVTWDPQATDPESISLRYLLDGTWSQWTSLEIAEEQGGDLEGSDPVSTVAGTEPFSLFYANAVEVVAQGADGSSIPGLTLVVVDAETSAPLENVLTELAEATSDEAPEVSQEELPDDAAQSDTSTGDEMLGLEGAVEGDGVSFRSASTSVLSSGIGTVIPAALNSTGTVFDTGYSGLKINTRKAWGADESKMTWTPKANKIQGAVIHHTESSNNYTQDQVAQQIRNIYGYHAVTLGWGDIGYNVIVDKFGGVWEGRAGGLTNQIHAAHAGSANSATFGITVMGSFMDAAPIAAAQDSVAKTIAWKLQLHGINSVDGNISVLHQSGKYVSVPVVSAHRDVGWTDCPGDAFYTRIPSIRSSVAAYMKANSGPGSVVTPGTPGFATTGLPEAFDAANIISDALFYNAGTMTEAQIKAAIEKQGSSCKPGSGTTCLKDTKFPTVNLTTLRGGCQPLNMSGSQAPWTIISKTAQACGLNPQVILTTLQKEQSGLTQPKSTATWAKAMGSGCPDGSGCDPAQGGFQKQVYYGADKLVSYKIKSMAGHVQAFKDGRAMTVAHNSSPSCGSQSLLFKNVATASLYEYTPYIGNSSVSGCGPTGQKNFYDIFKRYFPETVVSVPKLVAPTPTTQSVTMVGATLSASGAAAANFKPAATSVTYQWLRGGASIPGAAGSSYTVTAADSGKALSVRVTGTKSGYASAARTSKTVTPKGTVSRLAGSERIATNVAVNTQTMKAGAPLFIATANDFADALSVGPAASISGGSLMLTKPGAMSSESLNLVKAKKPSQIYVIGGTGAVSEAVVAQLKTAAPGVTITRVSGADRYATSTAILDRFFTSRSVSTVLIATGRDYPDALTAAGAGGALKAPVLLVDGQKDQSVAGAAATFLSSKNPGKVVLVGGSGVISSTLESSLRKSYSGTVRVSGADRYKTNIAVNDYISKNGGAAPTGLWVATGRDFPDALSAAVPAGVSNQRLVLSNGSCLPKPVVSQWIGATTSQVSTMRLVGGESVVKASVQSLTECG